MSRKFLETLRRYEEMLTYMSGMAHAKKREAWQGEPESERARCARSLEELAVAWVIGREEELVMLQQLNRRCLDQYARGDLDAGDFTVRDIQELVAKLRETMTAESARK